jgi:hypothetical protein
MKRFALIMICTLAFAAPAFAQAVGDLSAYADDQGSSCDITVPGSGTLNVYLVHKFSDGGGATGVRFKVTYPATGVILATFVGTPFSAIGSAQTDLSVGYGGCINTTTSIGYLLFSVAGAVPACSYVSLVAPDGHAEATATDCGFTEFTIKTGQGIMNPDGSCQCNIATEPTSWGKVKALYR